jgi:hypothetical protein
VIFFNQEKRKSLALRYLRESFTQLNSLELSKFKFKYSEILENMEDKNFKSSVYNFVSRNKNDVYFNIYNGSLIDPESEFIHKRDSDYTKYLEKKEIEECNDITENDKRMMILWNRSINNSKNEMILDNKKVYKHSLNFIKKYYPELI